MKEPNPTVILGVTKSDAHVVANNLLSHYLKDHGFRVINLGCCTPIKEFIQAYQQNQEALAIVIGSLNGHAAEDLQGLKIAKKIHQVQCPFFLGGNLSVGSKKDDAVEKELLSLGIDAIIQKPEALLQKLLALAQGRQTRVSGVSFLEGGKPCAEAQA